MIVNNTVRWPSWLWRQVSKAQRCIYFKMQQNTNFNKVKEQHP